MERGVTALVLAFVAAVNAPYVAEVEQWRAQREERLLADGGWLTVTGLFWLKDGANTFGSAPGNTIVLPAGAPPRAGVIDFSGGKARLRVEPGVRILSGDKPVTAMELRADTASGGPDVLVLGPLSLQVIERGGRYGIRLKDNQSPQRKAFAGLQWYPVSETYRVTARFAPNATPKTIPIANVLGQEDQQPSPGSVFFKLNGQDVRLDPILEAPDAKELFFIFKDSTSGRDTYPAGRYLYTDLPKDGVVTLDFNKAYSPPCAFTAYATCPLPPPQNRLTVRIEAGEKKPAPLH
jgi:uncharacterized protein (DUF1684 family)